MGVGAADGLADGPSLVAAEIVEDDEVAGPECRDQKLLDPGLEAAAVDRAVEDVWGAQSVGAQAGEEGPGIVGVRQWPWRGVCPVSCVSGAVGVALSGLS